MLKKNLPLGIGVGAIVLNNNNRIFVGKRKDNPIDKWQMPQGGVNKNENVSKARARIAPIYNMCNIVTLMVMCND